MLARRMLQRARIPWFSLDALRVGLTRGEPSLGLDLNRDDLDEAKRLWPILNELMQNILFWDIDYLVEGSCLAPSSTAELKRQRPDKDIRAIFLGSPELTPEEKLSLMDANSVGGNDWLKDQPDQIRLDQAKRIVKDSKIFEKQAVEENLPFFDTGQDFLATIDKAETYLFGSQ